MPAPPTADQGGPAGGELSRAAVTAVLVTLGLILVVGLYAAAGLNDTLPGARARPLAPVGADEDEKASGPVTRYELSRVPPTSTTMSLLSTPPTLRQVTGQVPAPTLASSTSPTIRPAGEQAAGEAPLTVPGVAEPAAVSAPEPTEGGAGTSAAPVLQPRAPSAVSVAPTATTTRSSTTAGVAPAGIGSVEPGLFEVLPGKETIVVRWRAPAPGLDEFLIGVACCDQAPTEERRPASSGHLQLMGLQPGTEYTIEVVGMTGGVRQPATARRFTTRTLPADVGSPIGPTAIRAQAGPRPGTVLVEWDANADDTATRGFFVSWGCCGGYLGGSSVDRDVRSLLVENLTSAQVHTVEVQALDANFVGSLPTRLRTTATPN